MITLIIDTSHSILAVGLAKNGLLLASIQEVLKKKHSERLVGAVDTVLKQAGIDKHDITEIVVTDGPGSYTGMRIGLTFVKVFALTCEVTVYTVDSLLSLVGCRSGFALIDARSNRVFGAYVDKGHLSDERVYTLDEVKETDVQKYGDTHLFGEDTVYLNVCENILAVSASWKRVIDVDLLVPRYIS